MFDTTIAVAPLDEALTFARVRVNDVTNLLSVTRYADGAVVGYNLTQEVDSNPTDPVDVFNDLGYEALKNRIESLSESSLVEYPLDQLSVPLELTDEHIAAGTNFAAHADESSVEEGPFLFAKMVTPTPFNAPVSVESGGLLDYEVELSYVTLDDTSLTEPPEYMGLILSNDFTNRAKLLRHLDPDNVVSGDGFTTGKSAPGFLPVGNLFVIPKNYREFSSSLTLELAVNEKLRQSGSMELVIWDIDELFNQIFARKDTLWEYQDEQVGLPVVDGVIPPRTLIMAGTPDGTIFQGPTTKIMIKGVFRFLLGGWNQSIVENVIEHYISSAQRQGNFLSPGDSVHIRVENMGEINTQVQ